MYRPLAIGIAFLVSTAVVLVSWRFPALCRWSLGLLRRKLLDPARPVSFENEATRESRFLLWLRAWAGLTVAILVVLSIGAGLPAPDPARAALGAAALAAGSLAAAFAAVLAANAILAYLPQSRALSAFEHHGFRSLWVVSEGRCPPELVDALSSKAKSSALVRVIDLTGHEFLGKGPGLGGGLLHDVFAQMAGVPVQVLLLDPDTRAPDPDHKQATVYQAVLGELELSPSSFRRKVRATLDAIESLNEKRAPEAKIAVRFSEERPSFRGIVFDDAAFVSAGFPSDKERSYPLVEIAKASGTPSLYEAFRRESARLWRIAEGRVRTADSIKPPSTVVRRRPVAEEVAEVR